VTPQKNVSRNTSQHSSWKNATILHVSQNISQNIAFFRRHFAKKSQDYASFAKHVTKSLLFFAKISRKKKYFAKESQCFARFRIIFFFYVKRSWRKIALRKKRENFTSFCWTSHKKKKIMWIFASFFTNIAKRCKGLTKVSFFLQRFVKHFFSACFFSHKLVLFYYIFTTTSWHFTMPGKVSQNFLL